MDYFEKWIGIIKFLKKWRKSIFEEEFFSDEGEKVFVDLNSYEDLESVKKILKINELFLEDIVV